MNNMNDKNNKNSNADNLFSVNDLTELLREGYTAEAVINNFMTEIRQAQKKIVEEKEREKKNNEAVREEARKSLVESFVDYLTAIEVIPKDEEDELLDGIREIILDSLHEAENEHLGLLKYCKEGLSFLKGKNKTIDPDDLIKSFINSFV